MGIFGAVMSSLGGMMGEQMWPYYQNTALNMSAYDLEREAEDSGNKIAYRAIYLLALMKKNSEATRRIYKKNKNRIEDVFTNLYNYRKFKPEIDSFRQRASRGSSW